MIVQRLREDATNPGPGPNLAEQKQQHSGLEDMVGNVAQCQ